MIDDKDIDVLEELSRLHLTAEEKAGYKAELNSILDYIGKLNEANVGSNSFSFTENQNRMREDVVTVETGSNTKTLIEESPESSADYVKVKKVLS
jgi:aspartyl/glutamyl-tRNA(Asn/Gln) amidotransferase C subunit